MTFPNFSPRMWTAIALLLWCGLVAGCASAEKPIREKYPASILLSDEEADLLCQAAWQAIHGRDPADRLAGRLSKDQESRTVFLSVSDGSSPVVVAMGLGRGMAAAVRDAATQVKQGLRSTDESERRKATIWLKVDLVQGKDPVRDIMRSGLAVHEPSLVGVALDWDAWLALLPEEVMVGNLVDERAVPRLDRVEAYFRKRGVIPARLEKIKKKEFRSPGFFRSSSFFHDGTHTVRLYRGHRMWQTVSSDELLGAAKAAGAYLTRSVRKDGSFIYIYQAAEDSVPDEYGLVRHAGTVYSMLGLYGTTRNAELLDAARRALEYLVKTAYPVGGKSKQMTCFWEGDGLVPLGASALGLLSLVEYEKVTGDLQYRALATELGNYIVDSLRDDGSFMCYRAFPTGEDTDVTSPYFPGESAFALVRFYGIDRNDKWLKAAEKAVARLIEDAQSGESSKTVEHDHWQMYALNELHRHAPRPAYVEQSVRLADDIRAAQCREGYVMRPPGPEREEAAGRPRIPSPRSMSLPADWAGCYYNTPRSTPASTRNEGLLAAYQLLRRVGLNEKAAEVMDTATLTMAFQLQCQIRAETAMYLPRPQQCLGGIRGSLTDFELRNDYSQHFLSSVLTFYRVLTDEKLEEPRADKSKAVLERHRRDAFPWRQ